MNTARIRALTQHPLVRSIYLPALLISIAQSLAVPILPLFALDLSASYAWVGLIIAGDSIGMLIGDIPAGLVARRVGQRGGMMLGVGLVALATLAMLWVNTLWLTLLLRVAVGLGTALFNVARHTFIADHINVATRGRLVALLGGTFRIGRMIGPIIAGTVALRFGLRAPFVVYALVCLLTIASLAAAPNSASADETAGLAAGRAPSLRAIASAYRANARRLFAPGLGQFLMRLVRAGPSIVIPLFASNILGLDVSQIGWILGAASAIDSTLFYPTGIVMDRWGRKWAVVPSALTMAAGLALIAFSGSLWGLVAGALLNGFGNGLGSGTMVTLGADLAPPGYRSEVLGVWNLIGDAGGAGGPALVGAVADLLALQPAILVIASTGLAAGLVFGLLMPEPLRKKPALA